MQLEMGISTIRYLPASGTAGLARSLVSGNKRVPWPPPIMTESTLLVLTDIRPVIKENGTAPELFQTYTLAAGTGQAALSLERPEPPGEPASLPSSFSS